MKFGHSLFALLVSIVMALAPGSLAAQQLEPFENLGDWEIALSNTPEGTFEVCMATKGFENEEAVLFYSDGNFLLLGLFLERWQLDRNQTYDISLMIDGGAPLKATAVAGEDFRSVLIDINLAAHFDALLAASKLTLVTGAGPLDFDITGAGTALRSMVKCAVDNSPGSSQ